MAEVRGIIFDCDGTLVDSEELGFQVIAREAVRIGVPLAPGEDLVDLRGKSMDTCLSKLAERLGRMLPPDFETRLRSAMAKEFRAKLQPMPGVRELLPQLQVPFCVATNGPRGKAELTLGLCGLLPLFKDRIVSAYDVGKYKPHPGLFEAAAEVLRLAPHECAVVEDSVPGMQAGIAAGMLVYAVRGSICVPSFVSEQIHWLDQIGELAREKWNG